MDIEGIVIKGRGEGAKLGFPTANVLVGGAELEGGIFAGRVSIQSQTSIPEPRTHIAALYIPRGGSIIEAHLLEFSGDLYGVKIKIEILRKIRDIVDFSSGEEARRAIQSDVISVKEFFSKTFNP